MILDDGRAVYTEGDIWVLWNKLGRPPFKETYAWSKE